MFHFSVLVVADTEAQLNAKLLPFYEYGTSEEMDRLVVPFLEFEVIHKAEDIEKAIKEILADEWVQEKEELKEKYQAYADEKNYAQLLQDWEGGQLGPNGDWGRVHNPNDKWDWSSIGGRWSGLLRLKDRCNGKSGKGGLHHPVNKDAARADIALSGDVDWEGMLNTHEIECAEGWDNWASFITQVISIEDYFAMSREDKKLVWEKLREQNDDSTDEFQSASWFAFNIKGQTREEHIGNRRALTFAFIDERGNWSQRGQMGFWACVSDKNPDYDKIFWQFIESLPAEQKVYVVDCHI